MIAASRRSFAGRKRRSVLRVQAGTSTSSFRLLPLRNRRRASRLRLELAAVAEILAGRARVRGIDESGTRLSPVGTRPVTELDFVDRLLQHQSPSDGSGFESIESVCGRVPTAAFIPTPEISSETRRSRSSLSAIPRRAPLPRRSRGGSWRRAPASSCHSGNRAAVHGYQRFRPRVRK